MIPSVGAEEIVCAGDDDCIHHCNICGVCVLLLATTKQGGFVAYSYFWGHVQIGQELRSRGDDRYDTFVATKSQALHIKRIQFWIIGKSAYSTHNFDTNFGLVGDGLGGIQHIKIPKKIIRRLLETALCIRSLH